MQIVVVIGLVVFVAYGLYFVLFPILFRREASRKPAKTYDSTKSIEILKSSKPTKHKAIAIVALLKSAYMLVHIMGNSKGDFEYGNQAQRFSRSLSHSVVVRINSLSGKRT